MLSRPRLWLLRLRRPAARLLACRLLPAEGVGLANPTLPPSLQLVYEDRRYALYRLEQEAA